MTRIARLTVRKVLIDAGLYEPPTRSVPVPTANVPAPEPEPKPVAANAFDALGALELNRQNVEDVLDEMVRPALNADGGDITLVKVEDNNVYVRLVGACSTCPSSVMTMQMGVERLLKEEFPSLNELIQVDA